MRPNHHRLPTLLMAVVLSWSATFLPSCSATSSEPCTQAQADDIDKWYHGEIAERCALRGYHTGNCPDMPEIEAEYDRRYDEWVKCSGGRK